MFNFVFGLCWISAILLTPESILFWTQNKISDRKLGQKLWTFFFFFLDLEQSYLGSDLILNHPNGVSTLYFQVATFQKRATLAESPPIPTTQQVPDRRPPCRTSDPEVIPKLPPFRAISFATPHYVIYCPTGHQADAQQFSTIFILPRWVLKQEWLDIILFIEVITHRLLSKR
jgi:hypothetical protein